VPELCIFIKENLLRESYASKSEAKKIKSSKFVVKQQKVFWKKLQLELRIAILT
jgi:hypothetical protein